MNERIRQLAEQAGISLSQKDYSYYWIESAEDIEKFAELIVRECALVAFKKAGPKTALDVLEHFGVEE
jgi:hypothetical protein